MRVIRPIVAFFACLLISLAILDVGMLLPDAVTGHVSGHWRQLFGILVLTNLFAAPVVAFGGFIAGLFILRGQRENGNSSDLDWMVKLGALSGATYGALASALMSQGAIACLIDAGAGAVAGAISAAVWCVTVERPRHA